MIKKNQFKKKKSRRKKPSQSGLTRQARYEIGIKKLNLKQKELEKNQS
jgi:hypothetical protein